MKKQLYKIYFLGLVLLSTSSMAQNYNKLYDFNDDFNNSIHTAAVKTTNNNVVAGGTLVVPSGIFVVGNNTIQITVTDPSTGNVIANNNYSRSGFDLELVDLIESDITPNKVLVVANATNPATGKTVMLVFKTNPQLGGIIWFEYFKYSNSSNIGGSAITSDNAGNYFVLAEVEMANPMPRLIKINDNGFVSWKMRILTQDTFDGVDLTCKGNEVLITGNLTSVGLPDGILIAEIDAASGALISSAKVASLNGNPEILITDLGLRAGESFIVGQTMNSGFVLQMDALLAPGLGKSYTTLTGDDLILTGIKSAGGPGFYVSFDHSTAGVVNPGLIQLNSVGLPLSNLIFNVQNYSNSSGLIDLTNGNLILKGATKFGLINPRRMSFVAAQTPLAQDNSNCSNTLDIQTQDLIVDVNNIDVRCEYDEFLSVNVNGTLSYAPVLVVESECTPAVNAKKGASSTIENQTEIPFTVYPNPSTGLVTLELNQEYLTTIDQLDVFNPLGELVLSIEVNDNQMQIDLSELSGLYFLSIKRKDGTIAETKRVLIK